MILLMTEILRMMIRMQWTVIAKSMIIMTIKHDHDDYDTHDREYNYVIHIPFHATSKGIYSFHMVQSLNSTNIQEWIGK